MYTDIDALHEIHTTAERAICAVKIRRKYWRHGNFTPIEQDALAALVEIRRLSDRSRIVSTGKGAISS